MVYTTQYSDANRSQISVITLPFPHPFSPSSIPLPRPSPEPKPITPDPIHRPTTRLRRACPNPVSIPAISRQRIRLATSPILQSPGEFDTPEPRHTDRCGRARTKTTVQNRAEVDVSAVPGPPGGENGGGVPPHAELQGERVADDDFLLRVFAVRGYGICGRGVDDTRLEGFRQRVDE